MAGKPVKDFRITPDAVLQDDVGKLGDAAKGSPPLLDKAIAYAVTAAFIRRDTKYIDLLAQRSDLDPRDAAKIKEIKAIADTMIGAGSRYGSTLAQLIDLRTLDGQSLGPSIVAMEYAARHGDAERAQQLARSIIPAFDNPGSAELTLLPFVLKGMASRPYFDAAQLAHAQMRAELDQEQQSTLRTELEAAKGPSERWAVIRKYDILAQAILDGVGHRMAPLPPARMVVRTRPEGSSIAAKRVFLSLDEFASLPKTGTIDPHVIRFSQDSVKATFKPPFGSVDDFAADLANKTIDPASITPIRIVEKDGMIFHIG